MPVSFRRVFSFALLTSLVACSGPMGGNTTPSAPAAPMQGADSVSAALDAAPEVTGGNKKFAKVSMRPDGTSPPLLINFVSDGPAQGGVPCISCVNGAQTNDNIGLTGPSSFIPINATWQYSLSFTDISYKGKCTLAWAITSGKKTIDSFSKTISLTSAGGFVLYALDRNWPTFHGGATLTGRYTCGKNKASLSAPLHFQ